MRLLLLFLTLSFMTRAQAQSNFHQQIIDLIQDSYNGFQNYKGGIDTEKDSFYKTTITIDGTTRNSIYLSALFDAYYAKIIDSVKEKRGKQVADQWRQKLSNVLGNDFKIEPLKIVNWNPASYGWKFIKGDIWVDVTVYQGNSKSTYWVGLCISNTKNTKL